MLIYNVKSITIRKMTINLFEDNTHEKGHKLTPREHLDIIARYGNLGRFWLEGELNDDITLNELRNIESTIRTIIMKYSMEMREYDQSGLGIKED